MNDSPSSAPHLSVYSNLFCLSRASCYCKYHRINNRQMFKKKKRPSPRQNSGRNVLFQICWMGWFPPQTPVLDHFAASEGICHLFLHIFAREQNSCLGAGRQALIWGWGVLIFPLQMTSLPHTPKERHWAPRNSPPWLMNVVTGFRVI